jgi:hypothetical protein
MREYYSSPPTAWQPSTLLSDHAYILHRNILPLTKIPKELWKLFTAKTSKGVLETWSESDLDSLAKVNINGRQIKNTVRTANTLAKSTKARPNKEHLDFVLETIQDFEEGLNDAALDVDSGRVNGE